MVLTHAKGLIRRGLGVDFTPRAIPLRLLRMVRGNYMWTNANGYPFLVDLRDNFQSYDILFGKYEALETELIKRIVRPGHTFVDVGANIGYYSILAAHLVGSGGFVFSVEPNPECAFVLRENSTRNGLNDRLRVLECAVAAEEGDAVLYPSASGNRGDNRLYESGDDWIFSPGKSRRAIRVKTKRLEDLLDRRRVDVIKIDVQGYEPFALEGMESILIENDDVVLISEFWPYGINKAGSDARTYLTKLQSYGFYIWTVNGLTRGELEPLSADRIIDSLSGDFDFSSLAGVRHTDIVCARRRDFAEALYS